MVLVVRPGHVRVVLFLNRADRTRCEICETNRPGIAPLLPSSVDPSSILKDWTCEVCTFYNPLRTDDLIYQLLSSIAAANTLEVKTFLTQYPFLLNQHYSAEPLYTPFMIACKIGHMGIVLYLVELGANICQQNSDGYTGLLLAAYHGHNEIVTFLIRETHSDQLYKKTKDGFSIGHMPKVYNAVNRGFCGLREKVAKIKKLMFDIMGYVSNSVLNLVIEYCMLSHLNANGVGEDRSYLDENSSKMVSRSIRSDDPYNVYGLGD